MKRIRKGIVVLVVAAGAVAAIGGATSSQANAPKVVKTGGGIVVPQARGSSWQ